MRFLIICALALGLGLNAQEFVVPEPESWHQEMPRDPAKRLSDYPMLTCDTIRASCNHIIDETLIPFNPEKVHKGDTIFVSGPYTAYFFEKIAPQIKEPYILVTLWHDMSHPGKCAKYLDDPLLIAWFCKNCDLPNHPKVFLLPIGLRDKYWPNYRLELIEEMRTKIIPKLYLCYMNHNSQTNYEKREAANRYFSKQKFVTKKKPQMFPAFLFDIASSKFVISPQGNGIDCHRTWEAMMMGAIPIVKHSSIDPLFDDLPVLLVDSWDEITEEFLHQKYEEMQQKTYRLEKLYAPYWINRILKMQEMVRKKQGIAQRKN